MISHVLTHHYAYPFLNSIGLMLFLGVFLGVLRWVARPRSSESYRKLQNLPFEGEPHDTGKRKTG